jgi:CubicO group peptidase (beta-lactamase class C family)
VNFSRQRLMGYVPPRSRYAAHHFFLSCRDLAKLGMVLENGGRWAGREIIDPRWIDEMTRNRVPAKDAGGEAGYGYLWWTPGEVRQSPAWKDSFLAFGAWGQYILVLPAVNITIAHTRFISYEYAVARNAGESTADRTGVSLAAFLAVCDKVVAAQA